MSSKFLALLASITSLSLLVQSPAKAGTFNFFAGGFSDGSTVSGSFVGEDNNNDSLINLTELTKFNLSWSGRTEPFPVSFEQDLSNLVAFDYNLGNQELFLRSEQNIIDATELVVLTPTSGEVSYSFFAGGDTVFSRSGVVVQVVPEPFTLFGAGAAVGIGAFFRREKSKKAKK